MKDEQQPLLLLPRLQSAAVAVAAAAWLTLGGPAAAEIQTVPVSQATQMAKPLQKQPVNKERIWLLLVLGGTALFGTTVVFENNATLFPAITKANKAMAAAKKMSKDSDSSGAVDVAYEQAAQQRLTAVEAEREWDAKAEEAVLAGLQQAKQAVLEAQAPPPAAAADAALADAAAAPTAEPVTPAPVSVAAAAAAAPLPAAAAAVEEEAAPQTEVAAAGEAAGAAAPAVPAESQYPPIIFEPGSIKPPGTVAAKLQGMSDADLEEALRRRQREMEQQAQQILMEQQAQQILQEQQAQKVQQAAQELVQGMSDEELEEALRRRQQEMAQQAAQAPAPQQQQQQ